MDTTEFFTDSQPFRITRLITILKEEGPEAVRRKLEEQGTLSDSYITAIVAKLQSQIQAVQLI